MGGLILACILLGIACIVLLAQKWLLRRYPGQRKLCRR